MHMVCMHMEITISVYSYVVIVRITRVHMHVRIYSSIDKRVRGPQE